MKGAINPARIDTYFKVSEPRKFRYKTYLITL